MFGVGKLSNYDEIDLHRATKKIEGHVAKDFGGLPEGFWVADYDPALRIVRLALVFEICSILTFNALKNRSTFRFHVLVKSVVISEGF